MTDYTPTTDAVRTNYASSMFAHNSAHEPYAAFNRWLARERAKAKAEALREAADAFDGATINVTIFGDSPEAKWWEASNATRKRLIASLRDRAAKLEGK